MLIYALVIFAIAALGGLILASNVLRDRLAPWALSVAHAILGAIGLILLIIVLVEGGAAQGVVIAFILLLIAALGGFFLASFHARKKFPPKAVVIIHALLAIIGFLTLLSVVL